MASRSGCSRVLRRTFAATHGRPDSGALTRASPGRPGAARGRTARPTPAASRLPPPSARPAPEDPFTGGPWPSLSAGFPSVCPSVSRCSDENASRLPREPLAQPCFRPEAVLECRSVPRAASSAGMPGAPRATPRTSCWSRKLHRRRLGRTHGFPRIPSTSEERAVLPAEPPLFPDLVSVSRLWVGRPGLQVR